MARQDPWNMAEAVILLDATLQYKAGKITRSEAVSAVSDQLRQIAKNKGQEIDEIYRNLNGISFQMASMESALAGYTIMKPATRLFEEAVSLYKTNPAEYRRVLEEAQALNTVASKTNEEQFAEWLSSRISSTQVPEIMALYEEIESFCRKRNVLKQPLFETEEYPTVKAVLETIESDRLFRFMHKRSMSLYYAAASHYCSYIEERNRNGFSIQHPKAEEIGHTGETESSSATYSHSEKTETKELPGREQNAINSLQADNDSKQPATAHVEDNLPAVTAAAEEPEAMSIEEEIKHFLKQECERSLPGVTSRFIESSFPNVSPALIKFTLKTAPWAIMRNNRWRYRELTPVTVQQQEGQKAPSEESSSEEASAPKAAKTSRTAVENTKTNEEQVSFVSWLQQKGIDRVEAQNIDSDIKRIETWAIKNGIPGVNLSSGSRSECANAASILLRNFKFRELNLKEGNILLRAVSKLLAYCSDNKAPNPQEKQSETTMPEKPEKADTELRNDTSETQVATLPSSDTENASKDHAQTETKAIVPSTQEPEDQDGSEVLTVDFEQKGSYSFTKPISATYFGETVYESSWRKLYIAVCKLLLDDYPEVFSNFRDMSRSGDRISLVCDAEIAKRLTAPVEIAEGYYVETNRSASDLVRTLGVLLDSCRVDYDNLVIRYVRSGNAVTQEEKPANSAQAQGTTISVSDNRERQSSTENDTSEGATSEEFERWLKSQGMMKGPVDASIWALAKVEEYATKTGLINGTIYDVTSPAELERIWEILNRSTDFISYKKKNAITAYAYKKYVAFRERNNVKVESEPIDTAIGSDEREDGNNDQQSNGRSEFVEYLKTVGYVRATANTTASAVARVSEFCIQYRLTSKPLFDITDINQLNEIWQKLRAIPEFEQENNSVKFRFSFAMKQYLAFRQGDQPRSIAIAQQRRTSSTAAVASRNTIHRGRAEFEEWLRSANVPAGSIKTYAESVERIGKFMLEKGLEDRNIFSIRGISRLDRIREAFIESMGFTSGKASATYSLDLYALKKYTNFRKNNSSEDLDEEAERFSIILRDNFENGFRPNSIIDRNRFMQYYADKYGSEPSQDNVEIVQILRQIGTQQEDRIFYREGSAHSDLLDDIQAEIARTFKNGASCIYLSELFGRHQEELAEQLQVFNQDVLRQLLLSTAYDEYYANKNCFCVRGVTPTTDGDIRKLMRHSQTPLDYDEIHQRLWYIPLDTIKYYLATSKEMVNVSQGTYFYAPNLPISAEELNRISELLHGELAQKSFVTDVEMRALIEKNCPSVAINTEGFTTWGLRNCLSVLLQDRFAFNGPIISEKGQALNTSQVFAQFCRSQDRMTIDELKAFAKEISGGIIYWEPVMETMVRISQNEFVSKCLVDFKVNAIDCVLDNLMDGDYAPISEFRLFLHFPAVGVRWNEFVLESFVAEYSKQFSLMHLSYTAAECCGGIVRKNSPIKDFQALITDVLAHSEAWKTRNDALDLLVKQGYLQRRHFAKIEKIVHEADLRREINRTEDTT